MLASIQVSKEEIRGPASCRSWAQKGQKSEGGTAFASELKLSLRPFPQLLHREENVSPRDGAKHLA